MSANFLDTVRRHYNPDGTQRVANPIPEPAPHHEFTGTVSAYAQSALDREADTLAATAEGGRNHQLNVSAFALGQLVAGGELPAGLVQDRLRAAATASGLTDSNEVENTMHSGLKAGWEQPRNAPEPDEYPDLYAFDQQEAEYQRQRHTVTEAPLHVFESGGTIFDIPDHTPAVWGDGQEVLWAKGEALILAGPSGVGKTTLAGQVVRGLIFGGSVLDQPVTPHGKILYLAMDRPEQIKRSLRRQFDPAEREALEEHLVLWKGPPPGDIAKNPHLLATLAHEAGAGVLIVDSLKDAAIGLSEDAVGAGYNSARQKALADNVQVLELHHQVKRGLNGDAPTTLADVYGSTWITNGAGSVIVLSGVAGDAIIDFRHVKQPAEPVGPFKVMHDHDAGRSTIWHSADALAMAATAGERGFTVKDYAAALFTKDTPNRNDTEKARRKLDKLVTAGMLSTRERAAETGGKPATVYVTAISAITQSREQSRTVFDDTTHEPITAITETPKNPGFKHHGSNHGNHAASNHDFPPPLKEGETCSRHPVTPKPTICTTCEELESTT